MKNLSLLWAAMVIGSTAAAAETPRPEHPRPDMLREHWLTLNGEWQFEIDKAADGDTRGLTSGKNLNAKIIVPFCPESKLSGIGLGNSERLKNVWYRRTFEVPAAMRGKRVRIHFGGVDYKSSVFINGHLVGTHIGESAGFAFDVTGALKDGSNEVVVRVVDDMWSGLQPLGKQSPDQSGGCVYTRTTGIWQPVWLEAVGSSYVETISVVTDPDAARVVVNAKINGPDKDLTLKAEAFANGKPAGTATAAGPWQSQLVLNLTEKTLWEPGKPFLYDLKLTLFSGKDKIDEVSSYFGLRKVVIDGRKILINGKPVFQRLILDQGFYPDGLWTAPTDQALKADIEMSMACGYNGARLHQKVFEPRFLYWADKLGYMVWGEYPSWGFDLKPGGYAAYVNEWTELLVRDRNHPSVIGWCPFNESSPQAAEIQQLIWNVTKAVDPTRPALETSGWSHTLPHPEVLDAHDYDGNPASLRKKWLDYFAGGRSELSPPARYGSAEASRADRGIPYMISEIGGIGWNADGGFSYGAQPKSHDEFYARYKGTIDALLDNPNLFGFCYTQLTDIEQEKNGLYYYDRKPKFDVKKLHEITSRVAAYERGDGTAAPPSAKTVHANWQVLVGAMQDGALCTPYKYLTDKPVDDWTQPGYSDAAWKTGLAPFGHGEDHVRTDWATPDIFLRKSFEYSGGELKNAALIIRHDEDTDVFVNGRKILHCEGFTSHYKMFLVAGNLTKALKKGTNTIAIHTHQTTGGQYIDLALLVE